MTRTDRFVMYRNEQLDIVTELLTKNNMSPDDVLFVVADFDIQGINVDAILNEFKVGSKFA